MAKFTFEVADETYFKQLCERLRNFAAKEQDNLTVFINDLDKVILNNEFVKDENQSSHKLIPILSDTSYDLEWSWIDKIKYALSQSPKPLTLVEIRDFIADRDNTIQRDKDSLAKINVSLLYYIGKHKSFTRKKNSNKRFVYSLLEERENTFSMVGT